MQEPEDGHAVAAARAEEPGTLTAVVAGRARYGHGLVHVLPVLPRHVPRPVLENQLASRLEITDGGIAPRGGPGKRVSALPEESTSGQEADVEGQGVVGARLSRTP